MASRMFLLCLLVSLLSVSYIESKGHGGHGGSHSSHSGGHSYGHSSGHSYGHSSGHSYGHSGSSSSHTYPSSSSGLSGTGSHGYGSSSSGSHTYPGGAGLSGAHSFGYNHRYNSRPRPTSNSYSGHYGSHSSTSNEYHNAPSYYKAPEYVYVNEYRTSNSRYGDLLTGLSLYNYGRSQSHYRDHYYYDDYYRRRYPSSTSYNQENPYSQDDKPQDVANCVLKVKEYEREEVLKIPCEIVSTFTEGSNKMAPSRQTQVNKTVCTSTFITVPAATVRPEYRTTEKPKTYTSEEIMTDFLHIDLDEINKYKNIMEKINNRDDSYPHFTTGNFTIPNFDFNMPKFDLHSESLTLESGMWPTNSTVDSLTGSVTTTVTVFNATTQNVTVCTTNYTFVDPLTEHGPRVDPKYMQCVVEIQTKDAFLSNIIDCNVLAEYAKLPEPKKETILPERQKLKSWLDKPPWWLSLFIAV